MRKIYINFIAILFLGIILLPNKSFAGNDQRVGEAGSNELLINPWARSTGWGGANTACVRGLEAMSLNVAGTAFTKNTELIFSNTNWLDGTDIKINSFGLTQGLGEDAENGVLGISVINIDYGKINKTTVENPDGGLGTFHPRFTNITVSYAKKFSNAIYGGVAVKVLTSGTSEISMSGVAIDAGIQYVTGDDEQMKFGISMKNVGPRLKYDGDALSFRGVVPTTDLSMTVKQRSQDYELPSLITIGGAYDFYFSDIDSLKREHFLTLAGNFTALSFGKDQYAVGAAYKYKYLILRAGYVYEEEIDNDENRTTALTGPSAGFSVEVPLGDSGSKFSFDYSYRNTDPFSGVHSIGVKYTR